MVAFLTKSLSLEIIIIINTNTINLNHKIISYEMSIIDN